jgi:hypothetical protein
MANASIHFEVFRRKGRLGPWALHEALDNRDRAIKMAKELLKGGDVDGVRVMKETFNEDTGDFMSLKVLEEGEVAEKKKKEDNAQKEVTLPCFKPDDLYSFHGRRTIAMLMRQPLARWQITATELMHHAGHLQRLELAGSELQHAVQKMAIKHAGSTKQPVQKTVAKLTELVDRAIERVLKDSNKGVFPTLEATTFRETCEKLVDKPSPRYRLDGAIAKYIAPAKSWGQKLDMILALMADLSDNPAAKDLALETIDSLTAELLAGNTAIGDLLGEQEHLGAALLKLADLFLGKISAADGNEAAGVIALSEKFAEGALIKSRTAIAQRVLNEINGVRRLCPDDLEDEVRTARMLATRMVMGQGSLVGSEEIMEAFTARCKQFVRTEIIEQYIDQAATPEERLNKLFDLEENIVGAASKREIVSHVMSTLSAHQTDVFFVDGSDPVITRLSSLSKLQARVLKSAFQENNVEHIAEALDKIACDAERGGKVLDAIKGKKCGNAQKVMYLLKLLTSSVFTEGKLSAKVRQLIKQLMQDKSFLPDLMVHGGDEKDDQSKVAEFQQLLLDAGIEDGPQKSVSAA